MRLIVADDARAAALAAAQWIAARIGEDVAQRGRAVVAFSGGSTPRSMLEALGAMPLPWRKLVVFQVDERLAPPDSAERNLTTLAASLPALPASRLHAMPVECDDDLESAASAYEMLLQAMAGTPPVLDLVHLGLGDDGHTASLFAADPALEVVDRDVVVTAMHRGHRRLSLSLPLLSRARRRVWLVTGAGKAAALRALLRGDRAAEPDAAGSPAGAVDRASTGPSASPPASRVARADSVVFADVAAAGEAA
jgi:6-phosphogluconolactonase